MTQKQSKPSSSSNRLHKQGLEFRLRVGVIVDAPRSGVHLASEALKEFALKPGDFVQLDNVDHTESIVRQIIPGCRHCCQMRKNYVYMDGMSAYFLGLEIHEAVWLKRSDLTFDIP